MQQAAAVPLWERPEDLGEAAVVVLAGGAVGLGIAVGMGSSVVTQYVTTGKVDMDDVAISGVAGGLGALAGVGVGNVVARPANVTLADGGRSMVQALTHYGATGAGGGFVGGTFEEVTDVMQGRHFDVDAILVETAAGHQFKTLGGVAHMAGGKAADLAQDAVEVGGEVVADLAKERLQTRP